MYFDSLTEFLMMGRHGLYVWLAYGIALTILVYLISSVFIAKVQINKEIKNTVNFNSDDITKA